MNRTDLHKEVTNSIIRAVENLPDDKLVMPWHRSGINQIPSNIDTDNCYQGINILSLWCSAINNDYQSSKWGTYKQWQNEGCQVRKGEKSTTIIFYRDAFRKDDNGEEHHIPVIRWSSGFNASQVDGYDLPVIDDKPVDHIKAVDDYVTNTHAVIEHQGDRACYRPSTDTITMPNEKLFFDTKHGTRTENYYSVLLHELSHWSGAKDRLNRKSHQKWGDEDYAFEELVAELGSAFQCAHLGISAEPRPDHAQYIASWLQGLKCDNKFIFKASAEANKAVEYLQHLQTSH